MKKFLIFVPNYFPDLSYGGPTISSSNLAFQLEKNGYKNIYIISSKIKK